MDAKQEKISEEQTGKKGITTWIQKHKNQILVAGVSVTALIATIAGIKNKDTLSEMMDDLAETIKNGAPLSDKWFQKSSVEELQRARELIQKDYLNPKLSDDYRNECWNMLHKFDDAISKIKWDGTEYGYPVHSSHGWYLSSDD